METLLLYFQEHAQYAHWVLFSLLMLAGLSFPISEDLLVVLGGVIASNWIPENTWKLFGFLFLGAYLSDLLVYWIGRRWGSHLWRIRWFARVFKPKRLKQIRVYYKKYGMRTLFIGRFIPFGVRNCLFMAAGIGKMRFRKFLIADALACLLSNTVLFLIAYFCGKNGSHFVKLFHIVIFSLFVIGALVLFWVSRSKTEATIVEKEAD